MVKKPTYEELEQRVEALESEGLACKQAEEALRESEDKFRTLFEFAPDAYYLNDLAGCFVEGNKAAEELIGYRREELIGKSFLELGLLPPEQLPKAAELLQKNIEGQTTGPNELILNRKDGSQILVEISTVMTQMQGQSVVLGIARDMTERKRTEEALKKSEHRYRTLVDTMNEGLVEVDENWGMTFVNDRFANMVGYSREQLIGRRFHEFASEAYKATAQKEHTIRRQGKTGSYELELVRADGKKIFVFCSPKPSYDSEGNYLGGLGVVADISTRKEMEEQLRVSEEKYRFLAENMEDIVWTLDRNFRTTYVSPSIEKVLGFTPEERNQQSIEKTVTPESLQEIQKRFIEELQRDKEDGIALNRSIIIEVEYYHKDGSTVWMENRVQAIRDSENAMVGMFGVSRDMAERKQAEEALLRARNLESLGVLAGGVAHEFNNALMGVMGNIELLEMDLPEDERRDRYFEAMKDSGHRMSRLTDQLLAYAQGGKYQPKDLRLDAFVIQTLPILQHDLSPEVRVETHFPKDISHIKADYAQMQMVLSAILANSDEAIENEGLIRITAENKDVDEDFTKQRPGLKPGVYVCLTIEDDGKGMDEETKDGIFEPFFTTKFQGRGMGMAAVYGIVKNHDGWIYVDSALGKGTVVQIYLPAIEIEVEKPKKAEVQITTGSGTILMIEDEDVVIEVTQAMLEWLGYRVMVAKTGKDAIHIAETFDGQIDLALLDIKLPDMEGGKVYPLIMKARPDLKVIVFSGYSIEGPAQDILDAGAQDFIQKPFSLATLSEKLKKALEGK